VFRNQGVGGWGACRATGPHPNTKFKKKNKDFVYTVISTV